MNERFFDLKKEKQDRMINAALKIFAVNGYRKASTDEMVKEAGISKGLLFHYFVSKAGLYGFVGTYSVKYLIMEMGPLVNGVEGDFFVLCRKLERARAATMKNFPFVQLFLRQAAREEVPEAREAIEEALGELRGAYGGVFRQARLEDRPGCSQEKLMKIVDYTLGGLLEDMVLEAEFSPDAYYGEALSYLGELERLWRQDGEKIDA